MKTILQILESPDKKHQVRLERSTPLIDEVNGVINDIFYLTIKYNSPLLKRFFGQRRVRLGRSCYDPNPSPFRSSAIGGKVIQKIDINLKDDYVYVIISRGISHDNTEQSTRIVSY